MHRLWTRSGGETDEGSVSAERTPHPALRATFSHKGRRKNHTVNRAPSWPLIASAITAPGVSPAIATDKKCSVRPCVALSIKT
ncbi:hypothetical protein V1283_007560 [Bradyrhizobium sp. AZCC 2262]